MGRRRPHYLIANLAKARAARQQYSQQRRHRLIGSIEWLTWGRRQLGASVYGRDGQPADAALPESGPEEIPIGWPHHIDIQPVLKLFSLAPDDSEVGVCAR